MPDERNGNSLTAEDSGEYRQRVRSLERQYDNLSTQIGSINAKIDEKFSSLQTTFNLSNKTPWNNIIAACSFTFAMLSGLVTLITVPIFYQLGDIKQSAKESRTELAETIIRTRTERIEQIADVKKDLDTRLESIRNVIVPREEHKERWSGQSLHDDDIQRQLTQLYENQQGLYNARDVIQQLQRDVAEVRRERTKN